MGIIILLKNTNKIFLLIILLSIIFISCNIDLITICSETKYRLKTLYKYPEQIPLTVHELKQMLIEDTAHYKVVVIYSPCCGPCYNHFLTTYKNAILLCDSNVKFYFIQYDYGGVKHNRKFLNDVGLDSLKTYYIKDTNSCFKYMNNTNDLKKITEYIYPSQDKSTKIFGIPLNFIVSKNNIIKYAYIDFKEDSVINTYLTVMPLYYFANFNFDEIDFNEIEYKPAINWNICTSKSCYTK